MFLKCFLATGGMVCVRPIFLPVVNYTPEDTTWFKTIWARWVQGKRHALGIAEMVYYLSKLPVAASKLSCGGAAYLNWKGAILLYKMFAIHIVMATYAIFGAINGNTHTNTHKQTRTHARTPTPTPTPTPTLTPTPTSP